MKNLKKQNNKDVIDPVAIAVAGAAIGLEVAVALKDKKNREKIKEVLMNFKKQAMSYINDMQKTSKHN